jgi:DNA polymerase-3 subunit delta'
MENELSNFDKIIKSLLDNFNDNKLHHGLLFSGNKGIGKASLALDLATKIILSSSLDPDNDLKKIQSNSHPDLLIIKKDEKKRDITIDAVREINQFLNLTAAISKDRVIIIDALDDLNRNSNNAILKTLEEPPANVFLILINHNQSMVMDTIKSRCHLIKINSPSYKNFKIILEKYIENIDETEVEILAKISDHSIGASIQMYNHNFIDLYEEINRLILDGSNKEIINLAKTITGKEDLWNIFEKLMVFYLYNLTKSNPNNKVFILSDRISHLFTTTRNLNLDKSQSIINIFNIIKNAKV